jgi:hypothetical protein
MRPRIPLVISTVMVLTVTTLAPSQATAAPAVPTTVPASASFVASPNTDRPSVRLDPEGQARLDAITALLPENWRERLARFRAQLGIEPSPVGRVVAQVIDPSQYECEPTGLTEYVDGLLGAVDLDTLLTLFNLGVLDYPAFDAILFGTPDNVRDYGLSDGSRAPVTQAVTKSQKFWDVDLSDVQTLAMHNDMVVDHARVTRLIGVVFPETTPEEAARTATLVIDLITADPGLNGGHSPIFTLNAYAFSAEGQTDPILIGLPDKVVFGEGLGSALDVLGLGATGTKAVMGHEMAHHVQFEQGYFDSPLTGPEATRRTELMADAFSTYFVAHKRGLNMAGERLDRVVRTFHEVGDCAFANANHHGTPNQRRKASIWGGDLARSTPPPFPVASSDQVFTRFERQLPIILLPDVRTRAA